MSLDANPRILCVGLLTLDVTHTVDAVPAANQKVVARSQRIDFGGPAANAAGVVAGLGGSSWLASAVGSEPITDAVRGYLSRSRVRLVDVASDREGFPISGVLVTAGTGERAVASTNAARVAITEPIDGRLVEGARCVLVDGHLMDAALQAAELAREAGVPVVFDGGSWKDGTDKLLELVDVAVFSHDFRFPDGIPVLEHPSVRNCRVVAQSHGDGPIELVAFGRRSELPVPRVTVVDTLGAGDVLHGALAYALGVRGLAEDTIAPALGFASAVAALSCCAPGARGWLYDERLLQLTQQLHDDLLTEAAC